MKRINLWSGPRNISTAMMYSFAQRKDTTVFDEPLYAHYLSKTPAVEYHPGSQEVLDSQEHDGNKVMQMLMGNHSTEVVFIKQMAHHLIQLDWSFMDDCDNIILTRNPRDMLPSYNEQVNEPTLPDVGYEKQAEILHYLQSRQQKVIVLEAKQVLLNPRKVLTALCEQLEIPFDENMLRWEKGARKEDGVWAKYWYKSVHNSTEFAPYKVKTTPFPKRLEPLYEACMPYYEQLEKLAIKA